MLSRKGRWSLTLLVILGLLLFVGINFNAREAFTPDNIIRFHVIAHSDTETDQVLKRVVRDKIVNALAHQFEEVQSVDTARQQIQKNLNYLEELAREEINKSGKDYDVHAEWGHFSFPVKSYGNFVLPAGSYEAVKVVLGKGNGENWWCVLFPPLCFVDISRSVALKPGQEAVNVFKEEEPLLTPQALRPEIRLKILEFWNNSREYLAQKWEESTKDNL